MAFGQLQEWLPVQIPSDILLWLLVSYKNGYQYEYQVIYYCVFWSVTRMVVVTTWISLQYLVSRNKIMKDYLAAYQEPDFLADEVCVYILSHILDIGIGVLTKSGVWTTTLADNMSNCEKYFAYCGPGIFIPIKHIQPGEEKILEERYLKEKEKDPKKGGKGGKGKSSIEKEKDKTEPPTKAAKKHTTTTPKPPTTHSS